MSTLLAGIFIGYFLGSVLTAISMNISQKCAAEKEKRRRILEGLVP